MPTPSPPTDAQADEYELALGIDRLERATSIPVRRINRKWAGLRTFAGDGNPVVGEDPRVPGFFWLAGQGGYGFKTAPALSRIIAGLILTGENAGRGDSPRPHRRGDVARTFLGPRRTLELKEIH